ncbi:MAG: DUF2891 domain-containing protein [Alcanivoracaceae bacterium]|nr:DUF2891 domain-containing protein [Alcanivoracaceae bacterium]
MRFFVGFTLCLYFLYSCTNKNKTTYKQYVVPKLNLEQANRLAQLPLKCVETEYPNKLHQTLGGSEDLKTPKQLHPAFYGCFDWHSAVHGYWSMVSLLKQFPQLDTSAELKALLRKNISKQNIAVEVAYFHGKHNKSWERTYGWAWLLKLAQELHTWDDPLAREIEDNLLPLTTLITQRYTEFLPKLHYQIRVGEHPNTAFGLSFAYDYAVAVADVAFKDLIEKRALEFYANDENCPISWEPGGFDFLSPCLQEMDIMRRVLSAKEFKTWFKKFLPQLRSRYYDLAVGVVSDREDGKLVHLDGVNFSRAWCLYGLGNQYPEYKHLKNIANKHMQYSLPHVVGDSYEGGHWLASFAIYALNQSTSYSEQKR